MQTLESFAETHRLRISRDECGDQIIQGRRGLLYMDNGSLCLMAVDRKLAIRSRWATLGGNLWMGDISPAPDGRRVQDVKIAGIAHPAAAFRMAGIFPIREMSEGQLANLAKARSAIRKDSTEPADQGLLSP